LHRSIGLANGIPVIRRSGKIGIRERDSTVWSIAQDIPRRRLAVEPKEKAGLRIDVGVPPPVQDDPGDATSRIESTRREHVTQLFAKSALILRE